MAADESVSHYRIIRSVGKGGMGEVFVAEDLKLGRQVAIKFLPANSLGGVEVEQRFITEAQTASSLDHPNIGVIHEIDRDEDDRLFIVMGFYSGGSLADLLEDSPPALPEALDLMIQVAEGMNAAHEHEIVHRDLKPANIMLTDQGTARVIDFGIAKLKGGSGLTMTGTTLGTMSYMSPEQILGKSVDHRSDLFSLGVILYELLAGSKPFADDYEAATVYAIVNVEPDPLANHLEDVPVGLQEALSKAMAKDVDDRYQSGGEMAEDLRLIRESLGRPDKQLTFAKAAPAKKPETPGGSKTFQLPRWALVAVLMVLVGALGFAGYSAFLSGGGTSKADDQALAVFEFRQLEEGADPTVSAGITSLVSVGLIQSSPVRLISPEYLYDLRRRQFGDEAGIIDDRQALAVARESGALLFLSGLVGELDGKRFLTWRLVVTETGETLKASRIEGDNLAQMADKIIASALPAIAEATGHPVPEQATSVGKLTTESAQAYRYFVSGMLALDGHHMEEAVAGFQQAAKLDTTFALAFFELSRIYYSGYSVGVDYGKAEHFATLAQRHQDHLGDKDKLRLYAWKQRLDYRVTDAVASYEELLNRWPDDPEILRDLLLVRFYYSYFQETLEVAEKGLTLYPDDLFFGLYYQICLAHLGRHQEALQATRSYLAKHPQESNAWDELGIRFLSLAQPDSAQAAFERSLELDPEFISSKRGLTFVRYSRGDLMGAIELSNRFLAEEDLSPRQIVPWLADNHYWPGQAMFYAEAGQYQQALAVFDAADSLVTDTVSQLRLETSKARLLMHMGKEDQVLAWARGIPARSDSRLAGLLEIQCSAMALAALDSLDAAQAMLVSLEATEESWGAVARCAIAQVSAVIALAENRPEEALAFLERNRSMGVLAGGYYELDQRKMMALALAASGRTAEAENTWLDLLKVFPGHAIARYHLAQLYEQLNQPSRAATQYQLFLEAWKDADPGLDVVKNAQQRLAALGQ